MTDAILTALKARANHRGLVCVRAEVLQEALHCSFEELERALAELSEAGQVQILSPLPYAVLAIRPRLWSGKSPETAKRAKQTGPSEHRGYSYSSQQQLIDKSKAIAAEDGGAGEGETLLKD